MRIGFIGSGSMVGAIARGVSASGPAEAGSDRPDLVFTDAHGAHAPALAAEVSGTVAESNTQLAHDVDIVVLGVKPHLQRGVIAEIRDTVTARDDVLVVSIAAGRTLAGMEKDFRSAVPLVRAMPNVAAQIGESMTALCPNALVSDAQLASARDLFDAVGRTVILDETDFSVFSALAGCSPAWVFEIIDALASAGVKHGLTKARAVAIVAQALAGSATLVLDAAEKDVTPAQLVDQVTSPGGTTIAGLLAAREAGLSSALVKAVDAAVARDRELG